MFVFFDWIDGVSSNILIAWFNASDTAYYLLIFVCSEPQASCRILIVLFKAEEKSFFTWL